MSKRWSFLAPVCNVDDRDYVPRVLLFALGCVLLVFAAGTALGAGVRGAA